MPSAAAELVFDEATKVYPGRDGAAVDHLSLTVPAGEICVLVGPSGGGKTTALKLVNRLIPLTGGDIRIDGTSILDHDLVELRRSIGYVIQQVGLFPHMTIEANIGTVPKLLGRPRAWIKERSAELLDLVGLDSSYAKRYPAQLSGGERQRIGLARALAAEPSLMLMDEPFGAIDPIVRARLQDEFLGSSRSCARPSSSSRTTSTRRSRSATASRSCARAGGSRSTTRRSGSSSIRSDDFVAIRRPRPGAQGAVAPHAPRARAQARERERLASSAGRHEPSRSARRPHRGAPRCAPRRRRRRLGCSAS